MIGKPILYFYPKVGFEALQYICKSKFILLMEHREINLN